MLAISVLDVIEVIVFGALGFIVVAVVCVAVLAFLQLILPKTDSGAEAAQREAQRDVEPPDGAGDEVDGPEPLDTEGDA